VKDCEVIRKELLGSKESPEDRKWTLMGDSFGGFCCITYLSFHSEGIKEVFITGGLAPLVSQPDEVYETLVRESPPRKRNTTDSCTDLSAIGKIVKRNDVYYKKYPQDIIRVRKICMYSLIKRLMCAQVRKILAYLDSNVVFLPNGGRLTPSRWQHLGMRFGMHG